MWRSLFPFLLILSTSVWGAAKVRFYDPNDVELVASNSTSFTNSFSIIVEESGESTSDSTAATAYVPFTLSTNTTPQNYLTVLPQSMMPLENAGGLRLRLKLTNSDGADRYLYAAYKANDNSYRIIGNTSSPHYLTTVATGTTDLDFQAIVDVKVLCDRAGADDSAFVCSGFTAEQEDETTIYYFLTDVSTYTNGTTISGDTDDGVYLKTKFSNIVNSSISLTLDDLRRGDKRLLADYTGSTINNLKTVRGFFKTSSFSGPTSLQGAGFSSSSELIDFGTTSVSGTGTILNLENDTRYYVSVGIESKYQLLSPLSNTLFETPQSIQALLEKQSCFILSAGFQEEHPITDFFQDFRDTVLRKFWLGRSFIKWYYATAPHYTGYIIQSPKLAKFIRISATVLYGLLKYWKYSFSLLIAFILGLFLSFKMKRSHYGRS